MLSVSDHHLAKELAAHHAVIMKEAEADAYPAFANGDRRKRPLRWVSAESFAQLTSFGGLQSSDRGKGAGFCVSESFMRRLKSGGHHAGQHREIEERDIYIEGGSRRAARFNTRLSAFDRLCRRKDRLGQPLLSKAEQEAGHRLIAGYAKAGHGHVATQNYMSAGEERRAYSGGVEEGYIRRLDASKGYEQAKAAMGEGLGKAVLALCCHGQDLDEIERTEKWARGSGLTLLKMGLALLVKHYGTQAGR